VQYELSSTQKITAKLDDELDASPYVQGSSYTYGDSTNVKAAQTHAAFPVKGKGKSQSYPEDKGSSKKQRPKPSISEEASAEHAGDDIDPFYRGRDAFDTRSDDTPFGKRLARSRSPWYHPQGWAFQDAFGGEHRDLTSQADLNPTTALDSSYWAEASSVTTARSCLDSDSLFDNDVGGRITPDSMSAIQESVSEEPKEIEQGKSQDLPTGPDYVVEPSSKFQPGSVRNTPLLFKH
jgi:hypothetical protein